LKLLATASRKALRSRTIRRFDRVLRISYYVFAGWSSLVARRAHNAPNVNRLCLNISSQPQNPLETGYSGHLTGT
jgi:hypothetical protein